MTNLSLELQDNHFRPTNLTVKQNLDRQEKLLAPFTKLTSRAQKVCIQGHVDPDITARRAERMTPRVVWAEAAAWDLIDLVRAEKRRLDEVLIQGNSYLMERLEIAYSSLGDIVARNTLFSKWDDRAPSADRALPTDSDAIPKYWQLGLVVLGLDCYVVAMALSLQVANSEELWDSRQACPRAQGLFPSTD